MPRCNKIQLWFGTGAESLYDAGWESDLLMTTYILKEWWDEEAGKLTQAQAAPAIYLSGGAPHHYSSDYITSFS
jgi:hypothetical protein